MKKEIDYSKTVMHKIVCKDLSVKDCYVGSTTRFTKRKAQHKGACNNENSKNHLYKVYICIRDNCEWINWDMILIEKFPCADKLEQAKRERYWVEELNANLNMILPYRTNKEKSDSNKELSKEIYKRCKDKISEDSKKKYICEVCGKESTISHHVRHERSKRHLKALD